jgi:hypothetical protein
MKEAIGGQSDPIRSTQRTLRGHSEANQRQSRARSHLDRNQRQSRARSHLDRVAPKMVGPRRQSHGDHRVGDKHDLARAHLWGSVGAVVSA